MLIIERRPDGLLHIRADGQLTTEGHTEFVPQCERLAHPSSPMLSKLESGFTGWTLPALWRDLKFDAAHGDQFGRMAVIGDKKRETWGVEASDPFFPGEMRFFESARRDEAEAWARGSAAGGEA